MKYAYTIDGTVTGLNRSGDDGEITGECTPQDLVWGMYSEYYLSVNGDLIGVSTEEFDAINKANNKSNAVAAKLSALGSRFEVADGSNFSYDGAEYVSDKIRIQGVQNDSLARNSGDSIRTFLGTVNEGKWSAIDGFIAFTCGEFIAFAKAYFERSSNNFTNAAIHSFAIESMATDDNVTTEDVEAYDIDSGWFE